MMTVRLKGILTMSLILIFLFIPSMLAEEEAVLAGVLETGKSDG